ncbi:MAG: hypothetical protein AMJ84_02330 [Acidithiobacillales bacterium SM23_46]|nr:MAG: hypothetical protein AMJ84_02330 [Acidithiobacillales bacterium SM23_46]
MKWTEQLDASTKELEKFTAEGREALKTYHGSEGASVFNVYWANVNVLRSALYANPPAPLVKRQFDDYMDDTARVAAVIMERLLTCDATHTSLSCAVEDRLIPGLGQVWVRYEPVIITDEQGNDFVTDEQAPVDYVHWEDFRYSPARTWSEVWWVARRVYMTKREVEERFGPEAVDKVTWGPAPAGRRLDSELQPSETKSRKAEIWEVWNKRRKTVCWYPGRDDTPLEEKYDYLDFKDFFPCPRPLAANLITSRFVPKNDYQMAKKQYRRVAALSDRIMLLEEAIRVVGAYDKTNAELKQMIGGKNNLMIPVENWAMYSERGGAKGSVDWFPLDMVVAALEKLQAQLPAAMSQLYELLGISDIMRGVSSPRETLGAQQMKSSYSSARLQFSQEEVAKFVTDTLRLRAEVISNHFKPETIAKQSNIQYSPDAQLAPQAIQLIKDKFLARYRIEVSTDTLSIPDYNAERSGRVDFITATGQFISQVWPLVQADPGSAPFLLQILQWGMSSFRSAQTIEGVFDQAVKATQLSLKQKASTPPQPTPQQIADVKETEASAAEKAAHAQERQAKTLEIIHGRPATGA